jgi:hypothetical protein
MIFALTIQLFKNLIIMFFLKIFLELVMKHLVIVLESLSKVLGNDCNKIVLNFNGNRK